MSRQLPIDFASLTKALINECEVSTERPCIMSEPETQQAPRPLKPYLMMKITTPAAKFGDDFAQYTGTGTKYTTGGQRQMTVSFQCIGRTHEEAYSLMGLWQGSLDQFLTQERLRKAGIAVWKSGAVADISALLNTGYEGRAQMDVTFGIASNMYAWSADDLGAIEKVGVQGTINENITTDITVPEE